MKRNVSWTATRRCSAAPLVLGNGSDWATYARPANGAVELARAADVDVPGYYA